MTRISPHFLDSEFECHHCGKLPERTVLPALLIGLEKLREIGYSKTGLVVVSGYRCPVNNAAVGGVTNSMHLLRAAADVEPVVTLAAVKKLGVFSGIGWKRVGRKQLVTHVDVRHASGHNTTGGTVARPTTWRYLADGTRV